jgi:hypothetical protein
LRIKAISPSAFSAAAMIALSSTAPSVVFITPIVCLQWPATVPNREKRAFRLCFSIYAPPGG